MDLFLEFFHYLFILLTIDTIASQKYSETLK